MYEREIKIIQADMREYSALGHSIEAYAPYQVVVALTDAGIDPRTLRRHPARLILRALIDLKQKADKQ